VIAAVRFPCSPADRESGSLPTVVASRSPRPVRAVNRLSPAFLVALRSARLFALRPSSGIGARSRTTPLTPHVTRPRPFGCQPGQDRFSLHRVNGEGVFDPRCLPSTNASLVRVACAATNANPPATSARLCRRSSASGALFRLCLPLARLARADARLRWSGAGLPVPRRAKDLSILFAPQGGVASFVDFCNHFVPIRGHNRRIVRSPPTRYRAWRRFRDSRSSMSFFRGPAGIDLWQRPKPSLISRTCHRAATTESGTGSRSLSLGEPAESLRFGRVRAFVAATP
jgi:hypothetical protein